MHWSIDTKLISPDQIAWINERYEGYKRGTSPSTTSAAT